MQRASTWRPSTSWFPYNRAGSIAPPRRRYETGGPGRGQWANAMGPMNIYHCPYWGAKWTSPCCREVMKNLREHARGVTLLQGDFVRGAKDRVRADSLRNRCSPFPKSPGKTTGRHRHSKKKPLSIKNEPTQDGSSWISPESLSSSSSSS